MLLRSKRETQAGRVRREAGPDRTLLPVFMGGSRNDACQTCRLPHRYRRCPVVTARPGPIVGDGSNPVALLHQKPRLNISSSRGVRPRRGGGHGRAEAARPGRHNRIRAASPHSTRRPSRTPQHPILHLLSQTRRPGTEAAAGTSQDAEPGRVRRGDGILVGVSGTLHPCPARLPVCGRRDFPLPAECDEFDLFLELEVMASHCFARGAWAATSRKRGT